MSAPAEVREGAAAAGVVTSAPAGSRPSRPAGRGGTGRPASRGDARVALTERAAAPASSCAAHRLRAGEVPLRRVAVPTPEVLRRRRLAAGAALAVVLAALVVLGALLLSAPAPAAGAVPAGVGVTVVRGGESLTDVARRVAPGADETAAVARIRDLNGLPGSAVEAGRPLRVPSPAAG